jgi:3-oxoacyl-[acyl-carrier protein] reductase
MTQKGKVALVTGASRGIGHAIALALGREGAITIGTATTEAGANKISQAFKDAGIDGCGIVLNVADLQSIEQVMSTIKERFGMPAILVNNAAVTQDNIFLRMKEEEWDKVIETNLSSIFRVTKACVRDMLKARWGRVITIGSVVGTTGNGGQVNYAAAKAGLIGLTKSLAQEIGSRNITVNVISPGFIDTDMTSELPEDQRNLLLSRIPMQRMGRPEDIANAVVFLASDAAEYITGQTLHVNGGMFMA